MNYFHSILSLTLVATATFNADVCIGFNDAAITADDQPVKAIAQNPATEIGLAVAGTAIGFHRVKASGAILAGNKVISAANGGVKAAGGASVNMFATALTSAADGEFVEILIR